MGVCCNKDPRGDPKNSKEVRFTNPVLNKDVLILEHQSNPNAGQNWEETEEDIIFKQTAATLKSPKEETNVTPGFA